MTRRNKQRQSRTTRKQIDRQNTKHVKEEMTDKQIKLFAKVRRGGWIKLSKRDLSTAEDALIVVEALKDPLAEHCVLVLNRLSLDDQLVMTLGEGLFGSYCPVERLDFFRCSMTDAGALAIGSVFKSNKTVTSVSFNGCQMDSLEGLEEMLLQGLNHSSCIREIRLADIQDHTEVKVFMEALKTSTNIRDVYIGNCVMGTKGMEVLANALPMNPFIHSLSLNASDIGGNSGVNYLAQGIAQNNSLEYLGVEDCNVDDEGVEAIAKGLEVNRSITEVTLFGISIGNQGIEAFSRVISRNMILNSILLKSTRTERLISLEWLANAVSLNSGLRYLRLENIPISNRDAKAFAEALKLNTSLQFLLLDGRYIGNIGAKYMAEAVMVNTSLRRLHLGETQIGNIGMHAFAHATRVNSHYMEMLDVCKSKKITNVGFDFLKNAIKFNTGLDDCCSDHVNWYFTRYNEMLTLLRDYRRYSLRGQLSD